MNINQLKYFVAAAELGSFTRAAEQFYISQTAITQQIQALEDYVGHPLFDRTRRPVRLTPAGNVFLNEAKAILERMDMAMQKISDAAKGISGSLHIGFLKGYERSNLSNLVRLYHEKYPNVLISFFRMTSDELAASLVKADLDIIFTSDSTNLRTVSDMDSYLVEQSRLAAVLYPSHPLAHRSTLSRADLKNEHNIYVSHSSNLESSGDVDFLKLYQEAGFQPNIIFRTTDIESALMMVAAEEGISILPQFYTDKLSNGENLIFIPMTGDHEFESIYAISKIDNSNPALTSLLEMLKTE